MESTKFEKRGATSFTDEEKEQMVKDMGKLQIDITMYRKATNVLDLNLGTQDAIDGFIEDPTSPINYDFIEDQYEEKSAYYWVIDLQDGHKPLTALDKEQLWKQLDKAIKIKQA